MGLLHAGRECDRITLAHTGTYQFGFDRVERLKQFWIPELDRLCVWGGFGGLQHGSNKACHCIYILLKSM